MKKKGNRKVYVPYPGKEENSTSILYTKGDPCNLFNYAVIIPSSFVSVRDQLAFRAARKKKSVINPRPPLMLLYFFSLNHKGKK